MSPTSQREYMMRIEALEEQLAAMTQERDKFERSAKVLMVEKGNACIAWEQVKTKLAASQAREQQLREALKAIQQGFAVTHQVNAVVVHALTLPQDDTALRQWGAKLLRDLADKGWPAWDADDLRLKADELEARKC